MKLLATITDKDITGAEGVVTAKPHIAVNAVLFNPDGKIALCYLSKYNVSTLVGGGAENGEDLLTAVKREVLEETGCDCEIIGEIGYTHESRMEQNSTIERYYFLARMVGKQGKMQLTEKEIAQGVEVRWHKVEDALRVIEGNNDLTYQQKYIRHRDIIVLQEAIATKLGDMI